MLAVPLSNSRRRTPLKQYDAHNDSKQGATCHCRPLVHHQRHQHHHQHTISCTIQRTQVRQKALLQWLSTAVTQPVSILIGVAVIAVATLQVIRSQKTSQPRAIAQSADGTFVAPLPPKSNRPDWVTTGDLDDVARDIGRIFLDKFLWVQWVNRLQDTQATKKLLQMEFNEVEVWLPQSSRDLIGPKSLASQTTKQQVASVRGIYAPLLSSLAVNKLIPLQESIANEFIKVWSTAEQPLNLNAECRKYTTSTIFQLVMGIPCSYQEATDLLDVTIALSLGLFFPKLPFNIGPHGTALKARAKLVTMVRDRIAQLKSEISEAMDGPPNEPSGGKQADDVSSGGRLSGESGEVWVGGKSFLENVLTQSHISKTPMDDEELIDLSINLLFAGFETTSSSLASVLYFLTIAEQDEPALFADNARGMWDILKDEQNTIIQQYGQELNTETLSAMQLTRCSIKEALRLIPPLHNVPRKLNEPLVLDGYLLEKDSTILCAVNPNRHTHPLRVSTNHRNSATSTQTHFVDSTGVKCDASEHDGFQYNPFRWLVTESVVQDHAQKHVIPRALYPALSPDNQSQPTVPTDTQTQPTAPTDAQPPEDTQAQQNPCPFASARQVDLGQGETEGIEHMNGAQLSNLHLWFGFGSRDCVGRHLAMMEMMVMVSALTRGYQVQYVPQGARTVFSNRPTPVPWPDVQFRVKPKGEGQ